MKAVESKSLHNSVIYTSPGYIAPYLRAVNYRSGKILKSVKNKHTFNINALVTDLKDNIWAYNGNDQLTLFNKNLELEDFIVKA
jgi:hypothetical protein